MGILERLISLVGICAFGALNIFIYWSSHLYHRSQSTEDRHKKIEFLLRANEFSPLNDLAFYELGKSYFDLGVRSLENPEESRSFFAESARNLRQSLRINPAFPYAHFFLGQAGLYLDLVSAGQSTPAYGEFRKAVLLAGNDTRICYETGKLFFSRWAELSEEDRNFTTRVLRNVMPKIDREKRGSLFDVWALGINDGRVIEKILPSDPAVYRDYANFLGERSLSLTERHRYLARAETLDFGRARREYLSGENLLARFQTRAAWRHFEVSYDLLKGIRFYQSLSGENLIDGNEYQELLRSNWLGMAKCRLLERAEPAEVMECLNRYLTLEDRTSEVQDLESYLRDMGLLPGTLDRNSDDLSRLALRLWLQFKQNKYREIVGLWREFQSRYMNIPGSSLPDYVRILLLAGDSLQKLDLLYDANDVYLKAFELDRGNLAALVKIRQNCVRLNNETKLGEVDGAILKLVSPREISLPSLKLSKGHTFSKLLVFDGGRVTLEVEFLDETATPKPLVAVFFNGAVIDEFYVLDGTGSVKLKTKLGENLLQILPVSKTLSVSRLAYRPEADITATPSLRRQD